MNDGFIKGMCDSLKESGYSCFRESNSLIDKVFNRIIMRYLRHKYKPESSIVIVETWPGESQVIKYMLKFNQQERFEVVDEIDKEIEEIDDEQI